MYIYNKTDSRNFNDTIILSQKYKIPVLFIC